MRTCAARRTPPACHTSTSCKTAGKGEGGGYGGCTYYVKKQVSKVYLKSNCTLPKKNQLLPGLT